MCARIFYKNSLDIRIDSRLNLELTHLFYISLRNFYEHGKIICKRSGFRAAIVRLSFLSVAHLHDMPNFLAMRSARSLQ